MNLKSKTALAVLLAAACAHWAMPVAAQTNLAVLAKDGAWTWFNDPRSLIENGKLYFGYVRATDSKSVLSVVDLVTGRKADLWASGFSQRDDHDNPGLLVKQDGRLLAIYSRHGSDRFFSYRTSSETDPVTSAAWNGELSISNSGAAMTYANPFQLSAEGGKIYNFCRNLNFNPTVYTSTDGGTNWSAPQLFIQTGTGSIRPYVKYTSNGTNRIDFLYTDGHPRDITNSLYHLYYTGGSLYKTDGQLVKNYSGLPLLHDTGERGSVIYQYSDADTSDPNDHIPTGRAWCWETGYQSNGAPVCVFTVQRDNVTGTTNGINDRIYYYYARWTGSGWQKRFIAQAGRPLYASEDDYAGGICVDPMEPNVVYISSNAQNPFNLGDTTNVTLRANQRYEIWRGTTTDGGLTFTWSQITTNSSVDNLRPYVPRRNGGERCVIWFRGVYSSYTSFNCEVVGLFEKPVPAPPKVSIVNPAAPFVAMTNLANQLKLTADLLGDSQTDPATISWSTISGPTNAFFFETNVLTTRASFPAAGTYVLRCTAENAIGSDYAEVTIMAGENFGDQPDASRVLWLKLNESSGFTAADSAGTNNGTLSGGANWRPAGGIRAGALEFNGSNGQVIVPDADALDNTTAFTLAYWFNASAYPGDSAGLVCKRNNISDNNAYTTYLKAADQRIYVDIDGANDRFSSASLINTGQWYHVALTFDGSLAADARVKLWINGSLDVTSAETSAAIPNYTSTVRLANTHPGATNWFNGRIDEVQFYRRTLLPAEISALASTNTAPSVTAGPVPNATNQMPAILNGSVADDGNGGTLSVHWSVIAGPWSANFADSNSPNTVVTFDYPGNYILRLSASDGQAETSQDLSVIVNANGAARAEIRAIAYSQTNLILRGIGPTGANFYVLASTNVGMALSSWTPVLTNHFDQNGLFDVTNPVSPGPPQRFFLLQIP